MSHQHDVRMLELLQQLDLANGLHAQAFFAVAQSNRFDRNNLRSTIRRRVVRRTVIRREFAHSFLVLAQGSRRLITAKRRV